MTFLVSPLAGKLTDQVGRKPLILFGRIGVLLLVYAVRGIRYRHKFRKE